LIEAYGSTFAAAFFLAWLEGMPQQLPGWSAAVSNEKQL
jgi:hypothetical protein